MTASSHIDPESLRQCWFLAGPTAVGKTAVSLLLAENLRAEIVAMDSMTLYRGMDIGTAKATPEEQARVPHHLLDLLDPWEEFSVARFLDAAGNAVRDILNRGKTPLFVGGTGLYLRSLLRGVFDGPSADPEIRHKLETVLQEQGGEELHRRLSRLDPVTADRLHPNDHRRLIRALEVIELTGQPISSQQQQPVLSADQRPPHVYWLSPPRDWLHERINRRVDQMFEQGLVDEVVRLRAHPQGFSHTSRQALGYKEILDVLEADQDLVPAPNLESARDLIKTRTRQFAKRQCTWFRNLEECHAIEINGSETAEEIADRIYRLGGGGNQPQFRLTGRESEQGR
ncbi:MAG: tRNA (adenosine(37)-N6)-dimethylallyltransferase MiaA [Planctomycetales bacterium]